MEIKEQIRLRFIGVDFPKVDVNSTNALEDDLDIDIITKITPKAFLPAEVSKAFSIVIHVEIEAKSYFTIKVLALGHFELSIDNPTEEERKSFVNANSTAIMFPYVRSFISTLTANLGKVVHPITLPTQFFKGDLELLHSNNDSDAALLNLSEGLT